MIEIKSIPIILAFLPILLNANDINLVDEFGKYPTKTYQGKYKIPRDYKCNQTECRDNTNKLVDLNINFAGKYCIIAHSCGTGCRYYSMVDVERGIDDLDFLAMFNTLPEISSKDSIDILLSQKDSNLLIVQYQYKNGKCKQGKFIFDKNQLRILTYILESCSEY